MRSALVFLLIFIAFAWFLSLYNNPLEKPQQVSVSQLAESVKKQEVKSVTVVEGSELKIELKDGKKQESQKEVTESLPTLAQTTKR
jgi:ATP-dependent Zn protease